MTHGLNIAFFGPSLMSTYRNETALYFQGVMRALYGRGHCITLYEPQMAGEFQFRNIPELPWARLVQYSVENEDGVSRALAEAQHCGSYCEGGGE